ncbi:ATP/GTP-binding protein [Demequina sp. NBRC 110055]|uniref:GTP-binding protein n=1 Tax=Demequina sp. NBRC 110055 TaxID=1570344 RepID=UPI000A054124|nr:ATP/GTP-binding protein [Demequina sp. NBRC 110055]
MTDITKILVAGPFGAGKTTFVATAADDPLTSERAVSDDTARLKEQTTVAMDHGTVRLATDSGTRRTVTLFGAPGQERFSFMWPLLAQGMGAYVLLVDASRLQALAQLKSVVRRFAEFAPSVPYLVAANRWDSAQMDAEELARFVGVPGAAVVACDPRVPEDVNRVLAAALALADGARLHRVSA